MSKFTLLGKEITFSKAEDNFCDLQFLLWKELDEAKVSYDSWYNSITENLSDLPNIT